MAGFGRYVERGREAAALLPRLLQSGARPSNPLPNSANAAGSGVADNPAPVLSTMSTANLELGVMQNMAPLIKDFADTAAIIAQLDCVVSVDTAVAHLAGAMGVPCHLLIPYAAVDWRWGHGSITTPWYESIIMHRQEQGQSWRDVLQNIGDSF